MSSSNLKIYFYFQSSSSFKFETLSVQDIEMKIFIIISVLIYGVLARPQDAAPEPPQAASTAAPTTAPQQPAQLNPLGSLGESTFKGSERAGNLFGQALGNVGTGLGQTGGIIAGGTVGLGSGIFDTIFPSRLFGFFK